MVMTWLAEDILLVIGSLSMECTCQTLSLCVFGANYISECDVCKAEIPSAAKCCTRAVFETSLRNSK